eukprot:4352722-Amphidinium_carterae.2
MARERRVARLFARGPHWVTTRKASAPALALHGLLSCAGLALLARLEKRAIWYGQSFCRNNDPCGGHGQIPHWYYSSFGNQCTLHPTLLSSSPYREQEKQENTYMHASALIEWAVSHGQKTCRFMEGGKASHASEYDVQASHCSQQDKAYIISCTSISVIFQTCKNQIMEARAYSE